MFPPSSPLKLEVGQVTHFAKETEGQGAELCDYWVDVSGVTTADEMRSLLAWVPK